MSLTHYDLGQRFAAAATGHPVEKMRFAPAVPAIDPVAVTVDLASEPVTVTAATGKGVTAGSGARALRPLADAGVSSRAARRTLVVPDPETLTALHHLARAHADGPYADVAAVIDWWVQRAEHPGSGSVLILVSACRQRWVTGTTPDAESEAGTWARWLSLPTSPAGLLALAAAVTAGDTLPGLEPEQHYEDYTWGLFAQAQADGKNWRAPDSRLAAATGLRSRCDAAELYDSLLLGDPLAASREVYTGTVVTAQAGTVEDRTAVLVADRLLCRLRAGQAVSGWIGRPDQAAQQHPDPSEQGGPDDEDPDSGGADADDALVRFTAQVKSTFVDPGGALHIVLESVGRAALTQLARPGAVTLRPKIVDVHMQQRGRMELSRRYRKGSWLAGSRPPLLTRRHVPIEVIVAAAGE